MPTPNLNVPEVAASQNQKEVTINEAIAALDNAGNAFVSIPATGDVTVTSAQFTRNIALRITGTPSSGFDVDIPASKRFFVVDNQTGQTATVQVTGGGGASTTVPTLEARILYSDGTDVASVGGGSGGGGGGSSPVAVEDEGSQILGNVASLNFTGSGVTVTDGGSSEAVVNIPGGSGSVAVEDEGSQILGNAASLNFTGSGVTVTDGGSSEAVVNIPGGSGSVTVEDEGSQILGSATSLNFTGSGVTVTDGGSSEAVVNIPGGSGSVAVEDEGSQILGNVASLNFTGSGVTVTDGGSSEAVVNIPGGSGSVAVEDEGSQVLGNVASLNFTGSGVTVTDGGSSEAVVNIPGGGSGSVSGPAPFRGARLGKTIDQAAANGSFVTVTFDTESFDTDEFHNNTTNNTRLTIPAGVGIRRVEVRYVIRIDALEFVSNGWAVGKILLNGTTEIYRTGDLRFNTEDFVIIDIDTGPIDVASGDYFEFQISVGEAATIDAGQSFATLKVVDDDTRRGIAFSQNWSVPFRGATVGFSADGSLDLANATPISWTNEISDPEDAWDSGAPTLFTVPAGWTKVRLHASLNLDDGAISSSAEIYQEFRKNGSTDFIGNGNASFDASFSNEAGSVHSGIIDVSEGDTLELIADFNDSAVDYLAAGSYFQVEVIETSDATARPLDVSSFVPGTPTAAAIVQQYILARRATLPQDGVQSQAFCGTTATAAASFNITKNGATVGTLDFAIGSTSGTFTITSDVSFVAGDRLGLVAPSPTDATLADVSVTFALNIGV